MSADNITDCPRCGEWGLREWYEIGIERPDPPPTEAQGLIGHLTANYRCECYECGYKFEHTFEPEPLLCPLGSTTCTTCLDGGCGEDGSCDGDCGDICASVPREFPSTDIYHV